MQKRRAAPVYRTPSGRPTAHASASEKPKETTQKPSGAATKSKAKAVPPSASGHDDDFGGLPDDDDDSDDDEEPSSPVAPKTSKTAKEKLAKEDAEIAALERKLGINNRKSLPKSFKEDGLGDLLGGLDEGSEVDEELSTKRKRKAEADEWLAQKRRKAMHQTVQGSDSGGDEALGDSDGLDNASEPESEADFDRDQDEDEGAFGSGNDDDVDSSDLDEDEEVKPVRKKENPYVAPTTSTAPAQKYVPPARRQESGSDAELLLRIRRQTQGLINRLTESNLLAVLGDMEKLYRDYPRQHVTSISVDLLLIQICEPTSLPDTMLILYAGFSTAVYQVIGPDFGAQLIQQTVERFQQYYAQVPEGDTQNVPKHNSNLVTFLSEMYNFQLIRYNLIFDYIRLLLSDLSEHNAELLLRIVRMAGQSLRRDDPLALKDIVTLIGPAVRKVGEANLSVRTKFMIESINDLKNNRVKTGASATAIVQDHRTRMRKLLGSMNTRKLKATEPLRIGLKDIEESDKRGKWWLVGASWAGRDDASGRPKEDPAAEDSGDGESVTLDSDDEVMPDLAAIGKENGMNTDVRLSIFVTIMSACDYEDAYSRLRKLRLNKTQKTEVAYVVMQCVNLEQQYNPYYALVAQKACSDGRIKFAFKYSLRKFFRRLGESLLGEDTDADDEDAEGIDARRIFYVAKMFGFLIAHGALELRVLECLNLAYLKPRTRDLVEVMLMVMFLELRKAKSDAGKVFGPVAGMKRLSDGLQDFLKERLMKSDLFASKKDAKRVKKRCRAALEVLGAVRDVSGEIGGSG